MFHHAVELFLWLLLAFALGAILGCLVRAAFGRGKEEMEYRLTGPRLSDAYKAEGGKGTPVGRALGLMGSGEESSTSAKAAAGMAAAATAGTAAKAASAGTSASKGAAEKTEKAAGTTEKTAAGEEKAGGKAAASRKATTKKATAKKAAAGKSAKKAETTGAQGLAGETAGAEDKAKWEVPVFGLDKPTAGEPDNLQLISGVGPKLEKLLHDLGIYYFAQIARWTKKDIEAVDDKLKFKGRIERDEWVRQAKLLAEGKLEQFEREYGTGGLKDKSGKTRSGTRTRKKK